MFERALKLMAYLQSTPDARNEGENDLSNKNGDCESKNSGDIKSKKCSVEVSWLTKTVEEVGNVCRKGGKGEIMELKKVKYAF